MTHSDSLSLPASGNKHKLLETRETSNKKQKKTKGSFSREAQRLAASMTHFDHSKTVKSPLTKHTPNTTATTQVEAAQGSQIPAAVSDGSLDRRDQPEDTLEEYLATIESPSFSATSSGSTNSPLTLESLNLLRNQLQRLSEEYGMNESPLKDSLSTHLEMIEAALALNDDSEIDSRLNAISRELNKALTRPKKEMTQNSQRKFAFLKSAKEQREALKRIEPQRNAQKKISFLQEFSKTLNTIRNCRFQPTEDCQTSSKLTELSRVLEDCKPAFTNNREGTETEIKRRLDDIAKKLAHGKKYDTHLGELSTYVASLLTERNSVQITLTNTVNTLTTRSKDQELIAKINAKLITTKEELDALMKFGLSLHAARDALATEGTGTPKQANDTNQMGSNIAPNT